MFEAANISKFAPEDKIKYEFDMTTERDIRNQIRYAEKKGREEERIDNAQPIAMELLAANYPPLPSQEEINADPRLQATLGI